MCMLGAVSTIEGILVGISDSGGKNTSVSPLFLGEMVSSPCKVIILPFIEL
jgi:hypothetical protein